MKIEPKTSAYRQAFTPYPAFKSEELACLGDEHFYHCLVEMLSYVFPGCLNSNQNQPQYSPHEKFNLLQGRFEYMGAFVKPGKRYHTRLMIDVASLISHLASEGKPRHVSFSQQLFGLFELPSLKLSWELATVLVRAACLEQWHVIEELADKLYNAPKNQMGDLQQLITQRHTELMSEAII